MEDDVNKNLLKLLVILTLAAVICLPGMVMAWTLPGAFYEDGTDPNRVNHGQFNKIEVFLMDGTTFDAPFIQDASIASAGWSSTLINPHYSLATGSRTNLLGPFTVELPEPKATPHTLDYFVSLGNSLLYSQRITWNGTGSGGAYYGWSFPLLPSDGSTYTYDGATGNYDRNVPLPPTTLLLGSGLVGLVLLRRKKHTPA
jgi:hypothetical protein